MINVKIRILRGLLEEAIRNIDAGNSNHTEEELSEIIDDLTKLNRGVKRISKTYACEKDFDEATLNKVRKYRSKKGL